MREFRWRDGERIVRFGAGALGEAVDLLQEHGFGERIVLTTPRAESVAPAADEILHVPPGRVDEISAKLLAAAGDRPLVAVGGGRVIDTAKAIAGATGNRCAAIPTTLSGAPMTPFHRVPAGAEGARWVRPALVIADPELMTSQPATGRTASAMNGLAHAFESLYTPLANPVARLAALQAARLFGEQVPRADYDPGDYALAALLAGYAVGTTGLAVHHALCQTIVRACGSPHAETNAVMLPHSARLMLERVPDALGAFAAALGDPDHDPAAAPGLIERLAARCGHIRLATLGVTEDCLPQVVEEVQGHPGVGATPDPPDAGELLELLRGAL